MRVILPTPSDFSFSETLTAHGWRRLLPFVWHEEKQILQRAEELSDGAVVDLQIYSESKQVVIDVEGEGDADELAHRITRMLQLDVRIDEFHDFCRGRHELAAIADCFKGRMLRCPTLWEDTVKVIATTNTTWAQTIAMTARLVEHFGAEGRAFPSPARIASVSFDEFAAKARMGYRNASVHTMAMQITDGSLDLEAWQDSALTSADLRKRLLTLPGVGPYAAACLMLYLGRPEHVNSDSWARMLLSKELGRSVTDQEVHAFFEPHGKWRGLVYNFYPWRE